MEMEKVLSLDGVVEVIFLPKEGVFEVWAMVSNGPDDFDWDVVLTTDDDEWAEAVAVEVWNKMETTV